MFRIAAGGKRVGCAVINDVDARRGDVGRYRELLDDVEQLGRLVGCDFLGTGHGQHQAVTAVVREQAEHEGDADGNGNRQQRGLYRATPRVADGTAQRAEQRHQQNTSRID